MVPPFEITNVVTTFNLQVSWINLNGLSLQFDHIKYNPRKFAAAVFWLKEPRTSTLVFSTGNAVCAGGRSVSAAMLSGRKISNNFCKNNVWSFFSDFDVCNVVGAIWCTFSINLNAMYAANMVDTTIKCTYNPKSFPGLVMRLAKPKAVFLVFQSGKVVCTGGKSEEDIERAFDFAYRYIFRQYACHPAGSVEEKPRPAVAQQRYNAEDTRAFLWQIVCEEEKKSLGKFDESHAKILMDAEDSCTDQQGDMFYDQEGIKWALL